MITITMMMTMMKSVLVVANIAIALFSEEVEKEQLVVEEADLVEVEEEVIVFLTPRMYGRKTKQCLILLPTI